MRRRKRREATDPVIAIADELDRAGIRYVFTGALALSYWGEPRASLDIDVVVHGTDVGFARFLTVFAPGGDAPALLTHARTFGHVLLAHRLPDGSVVGIDLIRPQLGELDRRILDRAVPLPFPGRGTPIPVVTPEDLIVYKLFFYRKDERHDDPRDIESILRRQGERLDAGYVVLTVGQLFASTNERVTWFDEALARHRLARPATPRRPRRRPK